jgi:hypothetical protein
MQVYQVHLTEQSPQGSCTSQWGSQRHFLPSGRSEKEVSHRLFVHTYRFTNGRLSFNPSGTFFHQLTGHSRFLLWYILLQGDHFFDLMGGLVT